VTMVSSARILPTMTTTTKGNRSVARGIVAIVISSNVGDRFRRRDGCPHLADRRRSCMSAPRPFERVSPKRSRRRREKRAHSPGLRAHDRREVCSRRSSPSRFRFSRDHSQDDSTFIRRPIACRSGCHVENTRVPRCRTPASGCARSSTLRRPLLRARPLRGRAHPQAQPRALARRDDVDRARPALPQRTPHGRSNHRRAAPRARRHHEGWSAIGSCHVRPPIAERTSLLAMTASRP
jgi:hypothetical protein